MSGLKKFATSVLATAFAVGAAGPVYALEAGQSDKFDLLEQKIKDEGQQEICRATTVLNRDEKDPNKIKVMKLKFMINADGSSYILLADAKKTKEIVYGKLTQTQAYAPESLTIPSTVKPNSNLAKILKKAQSNDEGVALHGVNISESGVANGTITVVINKGKDESKKGNLYIFTTSAQGIVTVDDVVATNATCPGLASNIASNVSAQDRTP